jgi:hypothetical protein
VQNRRDIHPLLAEARTHLSSCLRHTGWQSPAIRVRLG